MSNRIAMYIRLSSEDDDLKSSIKDESESITNQRYLLLDFIRQQDEFNDWEIVEFCDDGWSGKNFNRPGVTDMIEQAKKGRIQCIAVKDLSRFGRDYITVGNYLSRVFPFLGVRFISLGDGFDSIRSSDIDSLDTSFKTLIYDLYSRDISRKVRSSKRTLAEKGCYVTSCTYGYMKDPDDYRHIILDIEAAQIVRRIFRMLIEGVSTPEIVRAFNDEHIPTPSEHKKRNGNYTASWQCANGKSYWNTSLLGKIIHDERYTGKFIYGKYERDNVGSHHVVKKARGDWIEIEGNHEALISIEDFITANKMLKKYTPHENKICDNPLKGKVYCGTCGRAMARTYTDNPVYYCKNPQQYSFSDCTKDRLNEQDLIDVVLTAIRTQAAYAVQVEKIYDAQNQKAKAEKRRDIQTLRTLQSQKERLEKRLQNLYESFVDGSLDRDSYKAQKQSLSLQIHNISENSSALESQAMSCVEDNKAYIDKYKNHATLDTLTAELSNELVKRVTVYPDCVIDVQLNFCNEIGGLIESLGEIKL
ncbi:MAG: recombinase family protein [Eubacteriales bacterium]|nr:recombinase family protein [Eubacteriales bacterium]